MTVLTTSVEDYHAWLNLVLIVVGTELKSQVRIERIGFKTYTVKPGHLVTSIKQSPVLKGHPFLILS